MSVVTRARQHTCARVPPITELMRRVSLRAEETLKLDGEEAVAVITSLNNKVNKVFFFNLVTTASAQSSTFSRHADLASWIVLLRQRQMLELACEATVLHVSLSASTHLAAVESGKLQQRLAGTAERTLSLDKHHCLSIWPLLSRRVGERSHCLAQQSERGGCLSLSANMWLHGCTHACMMACQCALDDGNTCSFRRVCVCLGDVGLECMMCERVRWNENRERRIKNLLSHIFGEWLRQHCNHSSLCLFLFLPRCTLSHYYSGHFLLK